jgi:hypothetical protein
MSRYLTQFLGLGVIIVAVACGGTQTAPQTSSAGATKSPIGGACTSDAACETGLFCDTGDPGGQCLKKCSSTADCGSGAVCSDEKKCYHACQSKADCTRAGYTCVGKAPQMFCDVAEEKH